nr:VOC family protein [uncultured Desulfobacter sp.]
MKYAHTNIAARDWKTLAAFYCTVFNCRIKPPERSYSGEWLDRATGLSEARLEGAHLLLPGFGDDGPTLEIFTYAEMVETADSMANHLGYTHIAFEVDDVRKVYDKALEEGGIPLGKVTEKIVPGIGTLFFVYFKDPEGNIIEILSWNRE